MTPEEARALLASRVARGQGLTDEQRQEQQKQRARKQRIQNLARSDALNALARMYPDDFKALHSVAIENREAMS